MCFLTIKPHCKLKKTKYRFDKFDLISLIGEKNRERFQLQPDNLQRGTDGSNLHKELICVSLIAPASQLITPTAMFLVLALHWLFGSSECLQIRTPKNDPMIKKRIKNSDKNKLVTKRVTNYNSKSF